MKNDILKSTENTIAFRQNIPNEVLSDTKMSQEEANQCARCAVTLNIIPKMVYQ